MFNKRFEDQSKLYIAQIIAPPKSIGNWYKNLVGCLVVVRVRPEAERIGWPRPVKEIQYEMADGIHNEILGQAKQDDLESNGFDTECLKIICEYNVPKPKSTKPSVSKDDVLKALDVIKSFFTEN